MKVIHVSAECYPAAKVGGLADVVGALPKYQTNLDYESAVIMPYYNNKYAKDAKYTSDFECEVALAENNYKAIVYKVKNSFDDLGFHLYQIKIENLLDRENVYGYQDDTERFIAFQKVVLDWILQFAKAPEIIHCHDHHTGLIPFMLTQCTKYKSMRGIPTIFTIHNAEYQGEFSFEKLSYLPEYDLEFSGILEWDYAINPMAAAIKACWRYTTVSPNYMNELPYSSTGLDWLFDTEREKSVGILNGIDTDVWNASTDTMIAKNYSAKTVEAGKKANKLVLCEKFGLDPNKPLVAFIGRLVYQKGADIMAGIFDRALDANDINGLVLGSGDPHAEFLLNELKEKYPNRYNTFIGYDEELSHLIYAGADFLIMPSRFEPCGLNQLYALRYGTIPVVRTTGGLKDTVKDIGEKGGFGIRHEHVTVDDVALAITRANKLYNDTDEFKRIRKEIMKIDNSWENSAKEYIELYNLISK
ncbi:glycogen synthase [Wenyingzhuangia fucanilytica]|uniref:Glycogen synthase n=1 Tax=Wenyingzhuangia fucanilytica TaxID=1790137 RepID=A0A1B1Y2C8_9FLAO|nr:glycogen/starch synthase [Wenyingzhuangia fucanilytica]ANW94926.1 glycogen synthase [Wenyingzhuangia fucanilytica]